MRKSEQTIYDKPRSGDFGNLDKLCGAVLFRILAVLDVRVGQILPALRVVINLPMSFLEKTVRVASNLRRFGEGFLSNNMNLS